MIARRGRPRLLPPAHATGAAKLPQSLPRRGACRATDDPDIFFDPDSYQLALQLCAECPVRAACLEHALRHESTGVWGGTTPDERKQLRGGELLTTPEDRRWADELRSALREMNQGDVALREGVNERTVNRWILNPHQPTAA